MNYAVNCGISRPLRRFDGQRLEFLFPNVGNAEDLSVRQYMIVKLRVLFEHFFKHVFFGQTNEISEPDYGIQLARIVFGAVYE